MTTADWVGSAGVTIVLIAFMLNLAKKISQSSLFYASFNLIGGALSCAAACLLRYFPFIILEAIWTIVSMIAVINYFREKHRSDLLSNK